MLNVENIIITPEALAMIAEIDEFKGAWQALGTLAPKRLSALRRVATIESVGSSTRIEGSALSDQEVARLLANLQTTSFETRDEQEVAGYASVMELVYQSWADIAPSENIIRQLHRDLLQYSVKDGRQIGIVFATATPFDTPRLMSELLAWVTAAHTLHPLLVVAIFNVVLLEIHPFQDGNGRLSRILVTLLLLRAGYAYVPYSSLESVIEHNKEGYYLALRQTQQTIRTAAPDWQPWVLFFLRALQQQKRRLAAKLDREHIVRATLPELSAQILDYAREHGRMTIRDIVKITGASRNTVKKHLRQLVEKNYLSLHGQGRASWYAVR